MSVIISNKLMGAEMIAKENQLENQKKIDEVLDSFSRTTDEIFSLQELREKLSSGRQLIMKYGVDVTSPYLHIGHAVNLWMYRKMQEMGHKVIFLIGDYTTQIGDPTGKNKLRPIIPPETIKTNAEDFIKQALMVLHDDPETLEIRRNSEWHNQMSAKDLLALLSMVTHDQLIARDMFQKRIKEGKEIYTHEMIYPILQGYDSVALKADLTIIGSDQLFNEMMGRLYQERFGQAPQVIITTKITPGIDGKEKQSKSLGNYIGLSHSPREKFGRVMSIPDNLITNYFMVYTEVPLDKISEYEKDIFNDPMKYKLLLAREIVKRYHGDKISNEESEWFINTFSKKIVPEELPSVYIDTNSNSVLDILKKCLPGKSNSEIKRLIDQNGIKINDRVVKSAQENVPIPSTGVTLKIGKRRWFLLLPQEKGGDNI